MIRNRDVIIVRLESVGWASKERTDVESVVSTSKEVGIVADFERQMVPHLS
jgi:hypothetical protein